MNFDALNQLTSENLSLFFLGSSALIAGPPLVAAIFLWLVFRVRGDDGTLSIGRLLGAVGMGLAITFALVATGISLLRPTSPDLFIALIILCGVFAMLGAGQLYWNEDS